MNQKKSVGKHTFIKKNLKSMCAEFVGLGGENLFSVD